MESLLFAKAVLTAEKTAYVTGDIRVSDVAGIIDISAAAKTYEKNVDVVTITGVAGDGSLKFGIAINPYNFSFRTQLYQTIADRKIVFTGVTDDQAYVPYGIGSDVLVTIKSLYHDVEFKNVSSTQYKLNIVAGDTVGDMITKLAAAITAKLPDKVSAATVVVSGTNTRLEFTFTDHDHEYYVDILGDSVNSLVGSVSFSTSGTIDGHGIGADMVKFERQLATHDGYNKSEDFREMFEKTFIADPAKNYNIIAIESISAGQGGLANGTDQDGFPVQCFIATEATAVNTADALHTAIKTYLTSLASKN